MAGANASSRFFMSLTKDSEMSDPQNPDVFFALHPYPTQTVRTNPLWWMLGGLETLPGLLGRLGHDAKSWAPNTAAGPCHRMTSTVSWILLVSLCQFKTVSESKNVSQCINDTDSAQNVAPTCPQNKTSSGRLHETPWQDLPPPSFGRGHHNFEALESLVRSDLENPNGSGTQPGLHQDGMIGMIGMQF